jgi:hypothetical protein
MAQLKFSSVKLPKVHLSFRLREGFLKSLGFSKERFNLSMLGFVACVDVPAFLLLAK